MDIETAAVCGNDAPFHPSRYMSRLEGKRMPVVLLTNDADNRRKAIADGLDARGVYAYAKWVL